MSASVPSFPQPWDAVALALLFALLAGVAIWPGRRAFAAGACGAFIALFLQDQNRLWPSYYQFCVMLAVLATWDSRNLHGDARRVLTALQLIVAAIYFWAGVHKLNGHFFTEEFPWFMKPVFSWLSFTPSRLSLWAAAAAALEALVGVGLVTRRFRAVSLAAATAMHALIFVCIGPLRDHWNNGSWLWGQTVFLQLCTLYYGAAPVNWRALLVSINRRNELLGLACVALIGATPFFNGLNCWDSALSFNVYSGNKDYGEIHMLPGMQKHLPPALRKFVKVRSDREVLDTYAWALDEFHANPYPETRILKALMARVGEYLPPRSACLFVRRKASWLAPKRDAVYDFEGREIVDLAGYLQQSPAVADAIPER
ncbi:MAG: hypothetical protein KDA61_15050 [Planctomycetales bacterium]|nr:hypothetical protein [Planctomycetales bacterium]